MSEGGFQSRKAPKRRARNRNRPKEESQNQISEEHPDPFNQGGANQIRPQETSEPQPVRNFDEIKVGGGGGGFGQAFPEGDPRNADPFSNPDPFNQNKGAGGENIMEQPLPGQRKTQNYQMAGDDIPIPTNKTGVKNFEDQIEEQMANDEYKSPQAPQENQRKEKFSKKQKMEMRELEPVIQTEILEQLFSSSWNNREIAVEVLLQEIDGINSGNIRIPDDVILSSNIDEVVKALWKVNNRTLDERISQLISKGLMMLSKLSLVRIEQRIKSDQELDALLDKSILKLIEKMSDYKNENLRNKLSQVICDIIEGDLIDFETMFDWLSKTKGVPRSFSSFKHLIGKLKTLQVMIARFEEDVIRNHRTLLSFCCNCLTNSKVDVRENAIQTMVDLYRIIGTKKITQFLNNADIRKKQYEILQREFKKVDNESMSSSLRNSRNNPSLAPPESRFGQKEQSFAEEDEFEDEEEPVRQKKEHPKHKHKPHAKPKGKPCNFCKTVSPAFENDNEYDMHLWRDCPMLITCEECTQVVEIADYSEHLLEECTNKSAYEECPKCQLAILGSNMEAHLATCREIDDMEVRCPLCMKDLEVIDDDLEKTWFQHLIVHTCPKNSRVLA